MVKMRWLKEYNICMDEVSWLNEHNLCTLFYTFMHLFQFSDHYGDLTDEISLMVSEYFNITPMIWHVIMNVDIDS